MVFINGLMAIELDSNLIRKQRSLNLRTVESFLQKMILSLNIEENWKTVTLCMVLGHLHSSVICLILVTGIMAKVSHIDLSLWVLSRVRCSKKRQDSRKSKQNRSLSNRLLKLKVLISNAKINQKIGYSLWKKLNSSSGRNKLEIHLRFCLSNNGLNSVRLEPSA